MFVGPGCLTEVGSPSVSVLVGLHDSIDSESISSDISMTTARVVMLIFNSSVVDITV